MKAFLLKFKNWIAPEGYQDAGGFHFGKLGLAFLIWIAIAITNLAQPPFPSVSVGPAPVNVLPIPTNYPPVTVIITASAPALIQGSQSPTGPWMNFGVTSGPNNTLTVVDSSPAEFFRALATNDSVTIDWYLPPDPDLAGIDLFAGTNSGHYIQSFFVGLCTNATIQVAVIARTNYFAATSYDIWGNESDYSPECTWCFPPVILKAAIH